MLGHLLDTGPRTDDCLHQQTLSSIFAQRADAPHRKKTKGTLATYVSLHHIHRTQKYFTHAAFLTADATLCFADSSDGLQTGNILNLLAVLTLAFALATATSCREIAPSPSKSIVSRTL